jgi:uncharacterized membrane protein YkoI
MKPGSLVSGVVAALAFLGAGGAHAGEHEALRRAVEAGEIPPHGQLLERVRDKLPGDIVGVEAERKNGKWLYEFRTVDNKGRIFDVYVDATSGEIARIKEK